MSSADAATTAARRLLSGNEAIALGAWEAGCAFGSGYPGTPSSEILPALQRLAVEAGGGCYCEWSVNEKVAIEAASGASMTGARCLVTMKHVGLNVAADPFMALAYTGVGGGLVVVSADDPGLHSSQNEQDNRFLARLAGVPMLEPSDSQEAYDLTRLAFALSERFDTPVLLRTTTRVNHSRSVVTAAGAREVRQVGRAEKNPRKYVMIPAYAHERHEALMARLAALRAWAEDCEVNRAEDGPGDVAFVTSGVAYQYLREVLPEAPVLKLGLSFPLPAEAVRRFARGRRLIAAEELEPFLAEQVAALGVPVEALPEEYRVGEMTPTRMAAALREMGVAVEAAAEVPTPVENLPARPPVLCPGCPHRTVFAVLRRLGVLVTGDIGCYTLGTLPPLGALHTCLCMGAGISQAHGIARATDGAQPVVAVIGDSTFAHAGLPALANLVYNQAKAVVVILDNSTTAMTGGQDHPGTGRTLAGGEAPAMDFAAVASAMGVGLVRVADARDLKAVRAALDEALAHDGPAVVVARAPCVLVHRVRQRPCRVDAALCVACGACLQLGCPAIEGEEVEGKLWPRIDELACTGCGLCAEVCPKGAISPAE
jgi:indolepyruvate ferredoxin oxidoreductase alpha subunit